MNITVFVKEPGQAPEARRIPNELAALQEIVGGYIETVTICSNLVVICNEEGRLQGLPHNCRIFGVDFCGTIILAGIKGENFADAPETFIRKYLRSGDAAEDVACGRQAAQRAEGEDHTLAGEKRTATVTWYRPAEKLPEDDILLLGVVSGRGDNVSFCEAVELLSYNRDDGWILEHYPDVTDLQVHWWCELPCVPDAEVEDDE